MMPSSSSSIPPQMPPAVLLEPPALAPERAAIERRWRRAEAWLATVGPRDAAFLERTLERQSIDELLAVLATSHAAADVVRYLAALAYDTLLLEQQAGDRRPAAGGKNDLAANHANRREGDEA